MTDAPAAGHAPDELAMLISVFENSKSNTSLDISGRRRAVILDALRYRAAAPDLLKALEEIRDWLVALNGHTPTKSEVIGAISTINSALTTARAPSSKGERM